MGKKILVTGAAGFIGSHLTDELLRRGHSVVALDDLSGGYEDNVSDKATFVKGSIQDRDLLKKLFDEHRFEVIYHLGAYAAEGLSPFIRHFNYQNNLVGSVNLINLSVEHKVERFVFTSSIAVYGEGQVPMSEDMVPTPEDPYGISKYAVELDLKSAKDFFGLNYTIFRPHNVYGERQNIADRYRNAIGIFMNQIMQGEPITIFGNGEQTRAFSYVTDVTLPMVDCLDLPETIGEVFNVGADTPYTVNTLAQTIMNCFENKTDITHLPARNEVVHAYCDHAKIRKFFPKLAADVTLEDGIGRMARWAQEFGPRKTKLFMGVELWEGMPPSWRAEFEQASK